MKAAETKGPTVRALRVGEQVRHILSDILARGDVHDDLLARHPVSVTEVRMSSDLRHATVFVKPLLGKDEEATDTARRAFGDQRDIAAIERVSGNILSADVDPSHPLAFGVPRRQLAINKENTVILQPSTNGFSTVVRIDDTPRVNGYLSERNRSRVAGSAWLLVSAQGQGNVILFADDPAHRKYWHGTDRLLINAIFFGNLVNPSKARG